MYPDHFIVGAYIHRLHLSIDYALAVSYRRNMNDGKNKFVARITLTKGIPFYGFHVGYRYYLKIYMLNPMVMTRIADLLRQGVIMKKAFQPYEAHLQYLLQWMVDYNLYGCGYIDCGKVKFRSPVPQLEDMTDSSHLWHDRSVPEAYITPELILPRVSHCSVEVDICVQDILNRRDVKPRHLHQDFIERLNPLAPDEKLVHSMAGLWKDETRRRKSNMVNPSPGSSPFPPEVMVSMSADPRNSQPGGWIHEDEFREKVQSLIKDERIKSDGARINFDNFVKPVPFDTTVRTTLESVEDLHPENLRPALGLASTNGAFAGIYDVIGDTDKEVDEKRILGFGPNDDDEFPFDDDEDMREIELSRRRAEVVDGENPVGKAALSDVEPRPGIENNLDASTAKRADIEALADVLSTPTVSSPTANSREQSPSAKASLGDGPSNGLLGRGEKRSRSTIDEVIIDTNKRQRVKTPSTSRPASLDLVPPSFVRSDSFELKRPKSVGLKGAKSTTANLSQRPSSQEHSKAHEAHQSRSLNFPVVKDPHEPTTILRLSQKSASQPSPQKPKHVSFDPATNISPSSAPSSSKDGISGGLKSSPSLKKVLYSMQKCFGGSQAGPSLAFAEVPPSKDSVVSSMLGVGLDPTIYQDAYYSNEIDVPERPREWAGKEFRLESTTIPFLPKFDPSGTSLAMNGKKGGGVLDRTKQEDVYEPSRRSCSLQSWAIAGPPPTSAEVRRWALKEQSQKRAELAKVAADSPGKITRKKKTKLSQIDGPTQKNKHGFKYTQNTKTSNIRHEGQYMSTMSLEVHVNSRGNFVPNPEEDEIQCVFWCLQSEGGNGVIATSAGHLHLGIVVLSEDGTQSAKITPQIPCVEIQEESLELDLINRMVEIVRTHDPDILTGYEVHGSSWGYLIERARLKYDYNLCDEFSRMKSQSHGRFGKEADKWGFNNTSTIRVTGRHMINIWRAMRSELNLLQYTMENVVFHLLHQRIPHYTWADLTDWYVNGKPRDLAKVVNHYISRVQLDLQILEQNELIPRTSEQARLLGVDFFAVFSRGSQFKVESLMFRIAKPENFMLVSPSRKQVGGQNALECLPLVMEPQSAFYNSPLLVLDFQSLYPSVMIAYNYCYSTFLGRIVDWRGTNKMGFTEFKRQQRLLELLREHINIAPNGMMYTRPEIRKSLLAKMLGEILETRVMVKSGMKIDKGDKPLQRLLNNRQLALKLIANVTYGYTSASFSGRMPCSEIADSIVQTGRETLERAIALIHSVKRWGAEVVYGDTDSLFVYLKGRTKDQAFDIGNEIAKAVTNMNPRPVKLKFEKVYLPCVLLAKKRYVGFKYESRDQVEPDFDAKGIETVRRDGTPAEQKIEEKALKILFRTADLSQVKSFFQKQCEKIMKGSVSIQDFCFAREVKLGTYSDKGPPPPGALISTKRMLQDARAEPQYGERVPYVVITGAPGARLIDRCVAPEELLENDHCELDSEYYISKNLIPPLERIFNLMGANVRNWYDEMPKVQRVRRVEANIQFQLQSRDMAMNKKTLESYLKSISCLVCREKLESDESICSNCWSDKTASLLALRRRLNVAEGQFLDIQRVCQSCSDLSPLDAVRCDSKDCPVFYTRMRQRARLKSERAHIEPVMKDLIEDSLASHRLDW